MPLRAIVSRSRQNRKAEVPWSCELEELRLPSSASGPNDEVRGSRSDRAGAAVLAASPVAPDGTERTGQRDI